MAGGRISVLEMRKLESRTVVVVGQHAGWFTAKPICPTGGKPEWGDPPLKIHSPESGPAPPSGRAQDGKDPGRDFTALSFILDRIGLKGAVGGMFCSGGQGVMCPRCPFRWSRSLLDRAEEWPLAAGGLNLHQPLGRTGLPRRDPMTQGGRPRATHPACQGPTGRCSRPELGEPAAGKPLTVQWGASGCSQPADQLPRPGPGTLARPRPWLGASRAGGRLHTGSPSAREAKAGSTHSPASSPPHPRLVSLIPQGEEGPPPVRASVSQLDHVI